MNRICNRFLISLILCIAINMNSAKPVLATEPWRSIQHQYIVAQTAWWTCGAAAVATLLSVYYATPVTEGAVLADVSSYIMPTGNKQYLGLSFLALQKALARHGVNSQGYRLALENLIDYFQRGGLPVIIHLTVPQAHFVVAVGMVGNMVVLADPSFGERLLECSALSSDKGYSGYTLVPVPTNEQVKPGQAAQAASLARSKIRMHHLQTLGGVLHQLH